MVEDVYVILSTVLDISTLLWPLFHSQASTQLLLLAARFTRSPRYVIHTERGDLGMRLLWPIILCKNLYAKYAAFVSALWVFLTTYGLAICYISQLVPWGLIYS